MRDGDHGITGLVEWWLSWPPDDPENPKLWIRGLGRMRAHLGEMRGVQGEGDWIQHSIRTYAPILAQVEYHCKNTTRILLWAQSLPKLTVEELAPLLQSEDKAIREITLRLLGNAPEKIP